MIKGMLEMTDHETSSSEIGASHDNHHKTEGEDESAKHLDQTRCILLIPRGSLNCHVAGTGKREESAGHEGAEYDFVDAHLGFVGTRARRDLNCFFGRVDIVYCVHRECVGHVVGHFGCRVLDGMSARGRGGEGSDGQEETRRRVSCGDVDEYLKGHDKQNPACMWGPCILDYHWSYSTVVPTTQNYKTTASQPHICNFNSGISDLISYENRGMLLSEMTWNLLVKLGTIGGEGSCRSPVPANPTGNGDLLEYEGARF